MPKITPKAVIITWTLKTANAIEAYNKDSLPKGYDPKTQSTTFENCGVKLEPCGSWVTIVTPDRREYTYPSDNIVRIKTEWPE